MKQALISAIVAAIVCVAAFALEDRFGTDAGNGEDAAGESRSEAAPPAAGPGRLVLAYTEEPAEDSWVNGARGSGTDERILADAASAVCFLTAVEVAGFAGPEDAGACRIAVDDFTGFWRVTAEVPEGSRAEIRCNARCLSWQPEAP